MSEAPDVTPTPTPTPDAKWYAGADAELIGHIQTKGWHEKPANTVALEAIRAHREAEKFIGVPADQVLRLPKDATDEAGWKALHGRLGVPADAKGYDFTGVKFADGKEPDASFTDWLGQTALALNVPKDAAARMGQELVKYLENNETTLATERAAKLVEEKAALDTNWGANKDANLFIAKQAAAKLGVTPEAIQALEGQIGYAKVMEMFRSIGTKIGEANFIDGGKGPGNGIMTREQAVARKAELMADQAFSKRYLDGDAAAVREMTAVLTLITSDDTEASRNS